MALSNETEVKVAIGTNTAGSTLVEAAKEGLVNLIFSPHRSSGVSEKMRQVKAEVTVIAGSAAEMPKLFDWLRIFRITDIIYSYRAYAIDRVLREAFQDHLFQSFPGPFPDQIAQPDAGLRIILASLTLSSDRDFIVGPAIYRLDKLGVPADLVAFQPVPIYKNMSYIQLNQAIKKAEGDQLRKFIRDLKSKNPDALKTEADLTLEPSRRRYIQDLMNKQLGHQTEPSGIQS